MKIRNIKTIIAREYLTRVKKKSFLLTTFLVPVLFAAMCILPSVIMFMAKDTGKKVAVIDNSGIVMPYLADTEEVDYEDFTGHCADSLKLQFDTYGLDALVVVSEINPEAKSLSVASYSFKPMSMTMKEGLQARIDDAVEDYRLTQYEIDDLKQIMEDVKSDVTIATPDNPTNT